MAVVSSEIISRVSRFKDQGSDDFVEVTSTIKVERRKVLTNDDIERRRRLPKFGLSAGVEKGNTEGCLYVEDKEVFFEKPFQQNSEAAITTYNMNKARKDKLDTLMRRERDLEAGKLEEEKKMRGLNMEADKLISVKVSNLPDSFTYEELHGLFSRAGDVKKLYIPQGRSENSKPDFAFVHYEQKSQAARAIQMFNNFKMEPNILSVELAATGPQRRGAPPRKKAGFRK